MSVVNSSIQMKKGLKSFLIILIFTVDELKIYRQVVRTVMRLSLEREVWGSNLGTIKLDAVLPTIRHRCNVSSEGTGCCVASWRKDAKMGPETRYSTRRRV